VVAGPLLEHAVVEHRLVERDRQGLLGAEADGVDELLLVGDAGDLEAADADPAARDAEADALARQLVLGEEGPQGARERLRVAELAAAHDPARKRHPRDLSRRAEPLFAMQAAAIC